MSKKFEEKTDTQGKDVYLRLINKETGVSQDFVWNERKEAKTIKKRGLTFTAAAYIFFDDNKISKFDTKHDDNEDRFQVVGFSGKVLLVISTEHELDSTKTIRIISVRKAKKTEIAEYQRQNDIKMGI